MTLLIECKKLREKIEIHDGLHRAHKDAEAVRDRAENLREMREMLATNLDKLEVLRGKGVAVSRIPDPATVMKLLGEYRRSFSDGSSEGGRDYGRLKRSIANTSKNLEVLVEKALDLVRRDFPSIEEAFLKQVELIPAHKTHVDRIRIERDALLAGTDLLRMKTDELATFLDRRDELRRLADQLDPAEFPKEVIEFFRAARQSSGAPLEKLTEAVRKWLQERDQLKNVRVTVIAR